MEEFTPTDISITFLFVYMRLLYDTAIFPIFLYIYIFHIFFRSLLCILSDQNIMAQEHILSKFSYLFFLDNPKKLIHLCFPFM